MAQVVKVRASQPSLRQRRHPGPLTEIAITKRGTETEVPGLMDEAYAVRVRTRSARRPPQPSAPMTACTCCSSTSGATKARRHPSSHRAAHRFDLTGALPGVVGLSDLTYGLTV